MGKIKMSAIASYWDKQAEIWREEKEEAWKTDETQYWIDYFKSILPQLSGNKVLEIGTASGYFANILKLSGYEVTAVDISPDMIAEAKKVSSQLGLNVDYYTMDAQDLRFESESFDLIFTRLMTWTIPDIPLFYQSCYQLLKMKGTFINFDGDMGKLQFSSEVGHEKYPLEIMQEANDIKSQLEVNKQNRPSYDVRILENLGFSNVSCDLQTQNKILHQAEDQSALFEIKAMKTNDNTYLYSTKSKDCE